ncbi:MAG: hypothetical protein ACLFTH_00135 [Candidatus Woesearchaeota archaeon]
MGLFRTTKASLTLVVVAELIIAVMVMVMFIGVYDVFADEKQVENIGMARDVATLIDATHATTKDLTYAYPESFYEKDLFLNHSVLIVTDDTSLSRKEAEIRFFTAHPIHRSAFTELASVQQIDAARFTLEKEDGMLSIISGDKTRETQDKNMITTTEIKRDNILLYAVSEEDRSTTLSAKLAKELNTRMTLEGFNINATEPNITIRFGRHSESERLIIYYETAHEKKTKSLARNMINYLERSEGFEITPEPLSYKHPERVASIKIALPKESNIDTHFTKHGSTDAFMERVIQSLKDHYPEK